MFTSIFVNGSLTAGSVFLSLGLALLLGFAGALYYTKRNITATRSFAFTLALLPIIIIAPLANSIPNLSGAFGSKRCPQQGTN